jgi:hypothetical protein
VATRVSPADASTSTRSIAIEIATTRGFIDFSSLFRRYTCATPTTWTTLLSGRRGRQVCVVDVTQIRKPLASAISLVFETRGMRTSAYATVVVSLVLQGTYFHTPLFFLASLLVAIPRCLDHVAIHLVARVPSLRPLVRISQNSHPSSISQFRSPDSSLWVRRPSPFPYSPTPPPCSSNTGTQSSLALPLRGCAEAFDPRCRRCRLNSERAQGSVLCAAGLEVWYAAATRACESARVFRNRGEGSAAHLSGFFFACEGR